MTKAPAGTPQVKNSNGRLQIVITPNALYPRDNTALALSLVAMGLQKNDGTALDSSSMSRIKGVVEYLRSND